MAAPAFGGDQQDRSRRLSVRQPNLGVYLDRPSLDKEPRSLDDCRNVRIKNRRVENNNLGWENFPPGASDVDRINLDGQQVLMIDQYFSRAGSQTLIFASRKDVFRFNEVAGDVSYMTPIYSTGTVTNGGGPATTITGTGTAWATDRATLPVASGYGANAVAGMEIAFGDAAETDPAATWYEIDAVNSDTELEILVDPGTISPGTDYTIRQTFTGDNFDIWDAEIFLDAQSSGVPAVNNKDAYFMTNGVQMLYWDGAADTMAWFYPGFVARGFVQHKQILWAFYCLDGGETKSTTVKYSALTDPTNFTTNDAGEFVAADGVSDLLDMSPIGDQLAAYYNRDIALVQYVGPPLGVIARTSIPGLGVAAPGAIMDFGDYHEFLSADGAYRFDGVSLDEVGPQVFREVLRTIAPNRIDRAFAHIDEENGEVLWSVPLTTDGQDEDQPPVTAYAMHYLEDVGSSLPVPMTIRDFPATATGFFSRTDSLRFSDLPGIPWEDYNFKFDDRAFQAAFPFNLMGTGDGDIFIFGTRNTQNGVGYESFAKFPRVALGDGDVKALVRRIEPYTSRRSGSGAYTLKVDIELYEHADGDVVKTERGVHDMTHMEATRYVPFRTSGRYGSVKFSTDGATGGEPWDFGGYSALVTPLGSR